MPFQLLDEQKTFANFLGKLHHMPQKLLDFSIYESLSFVVCN
jgi:hypothetical protein